MTPRKILKNRSVPMDSLQTLNGPEIPYHHSPLSCRTGYIFRLGVGYFSKIEENSHYCPDCPKRPVELLLWCFSIKIWLVITMRRNLSKLLSVLTLKDAGGGTKCPPVRRLSAISHRIMLGSQKFLTLSINILPRR